MQFDKTFSKQNITIQEIKASEVRLGFRNTALPAFVIYLLLNKYIKTFFSATTTEWWRLVHTYRHRIAE